MGTPIEDQPIPMVQFEEESSTNSPRSVIKDHEKLVDESSKQGLLDASSLTVPVAVVGVSEDYNDGSNGQLHDQLDSDSGVEGSVHDAGKDSQVSAQGVAVTFVKPAQIKVRTGDPINSDDDPNRVVIDTSPPFESVKDEVSKFGGIVDWSSRKVPTAEKRENIEQELEKVQQDIPVYKEQSEVAKQSNIQLQNDLESTKRLIEDLKLTLERAQTEERQAQQNSELAHLRVKEMEQRIANETEPQLQEAKITDDEAISDLKTVKNELQTLRLEYAASLTEKYAAEKKAEESVSILGDVEKTVEELTTKLKSTKEALEFAHAAHLEAEEHRTGEAMAKEKDCFSCDEDLKQAKEDLAKLNEQINKNKDLKSKLNSASTLVANLKAELADCSELKVSQEVKGKAMDEVDCLKVAATSLKEELEKEKLELDNLRQREGMAKTEVASLEAELDGIKSDIAVVKTREKEARETMTDLPEELEHASREAEEATSFVELARVELKKAKEEVEQAKAEAKYMEIRLTTAQKEIDAARASESLEQESPRNDNGVTIPLEKYNELSKQANEAEEEANMKVATAMSQIELAREKELRSLAQLEEANREVEHRKEALRIAMEKAVKAKEGKERIENELRKWRGETGKSVEEGQGLKDPQTTTQDSEDSDTSPTAAFGESNTVKKKKKALFPRFFMFFTKIRKSSSKT
ncbi:protein WEAK CHLOROPLAST MOVEMENT UNDER BLUE LIGHT 1-like [Silene latifolia]|uniref:protein WEAK CHLOROPLAST MOVEMENT UNDER BLUE LIGHT 1-like n=1 Tax=Silene latifolia TaxID=37657 RepID=UPI003D771C16